MHIQLFGGTKCVTSALDLPFLIASFKINCEYLKFKRFQHEYCRPSTHPVGISEASDFS